MVRNIRESHQLSESFDAKDAKVSDGGARAAQRSHTPSPPYGDAVPGGEPLVVKVAFTRLVACWEPKRPSGDIGV